MRPPLSAGEIVPAFKLEAASSAASMRPPLSAGEIYWRRTIGGVVVTLQ